MAGLRIFQPLSVITLFDGSAFKLFDGTIAATRFCFSHRLAC